MQTRGRPRRNAGPLTPSTRGNPKTPPTPHTSLVYDWIGSPRVSGAVVDAILRKEPSLGREVLFDGVALVDMRGADVGAWKVMDRISLSECAASDE